MPVRSLFATPFYDSVIDDPALLTALESSCRSLVSDDTAGRRWCKDHGYRGYTSYASLDDLPQRDPNFGDLKRLLDRKAKQFAALAHFDLDRAPKLDSMWVNVMKPGATHSGHIHPHSIISGTVYVTVPPGSGALKVEDPRLPMMMAAPLRTASAPDEVKPFVYVQPQAGTLYLWESWLRHEVMVNAAKSDRISISFNYR